MSKPLKDYLISLSVGLAIALAVVLLIKQNGAILSRLCDGFFTGGALLVGAAGVWAGSNNGMFHIFRFGILSVFYTAWPVADKRTPEERKENYGEYVLRRQKRKMKSPKGTLLAGVTLLFPAILCLVLYYTV